MREISKQLRALIAMIAILTIGSAGAAAEPEEERASILLLDVGPQLGTRTDTLRVHLSDVARLVVEQATDLPTTQQRVQTAVARCRTLGAAAAVFVEDLSGVQLRVYWVEPRRGRVWMRELAIGSDGFEAASEKAALVARGGIQELLEAGRLSTAPLLSVEPQEPVVVRSVPARAPAPSEPPRWALGAGYHGTSPIEEAAWQHGLQLVGSYRFVGPLYLAGRYTVAPGVTVEHAAGAAELARHPAELVFGYRAPWRVALRAELGMFVEHLVRHTTRVDGGQRPTSDSQRFLLGASARMGLDLHVLSRIRLVGLFGAQVPFNHFDYLAVDDPRGPVAIHVRVVRPLVEVGLVIDLW